MTKEQLEMIKTKEEEWKPLKENLYDVRNAELLATIGNNVLLREVAFWANELTEKEQKNLVTIIKDMFANSLKN